MSTRIASLGFIQLPILLVIIAIGIVGTYSVAKLPEYIKEVKDRQLQKELAEKSLPEGAASADTILVGFRTEVPPAQRDFVHQQQNIALKKRINQINTDVVHVPTGTTVPELIEKYRQNPQVEYAEPNFLAAAFLTPNDPYFNNQWNLQKILAEDAYDVSKGGYTHIAIVDTGVDGSHPDLSGLVLTGYNTIDESTNTFDDHGHGTHVAGIAAATTDNSNGIASVSYVAKILPVKVLTKDGYGTYSDVAEGIIYAADNGSRIINLSLGGSSDSITLKKAVSYAQGKGSILVAAAGNNGNDAAVYPADYEGVLAISASDQNDDLASFSSYGSNIFVASPGVSILSSLPGGDYGQYNGTSMATPHLAGLLALSLAYESSLSNSDLIEHIKNSAEKVGSYSYDENGWNSYFGYGRISAGKTLKAIEGESSAPTPTPAPSTDSLQQPQQEKVPEAYSFSFELQGMVESIDTSLGKTTIKVDGGTPNALAHMSGNLVDVYVNVQTRIRYQGNNIALSDLNPKAYMNIKGNVLQNKLVALEILVQYIPTILPTQPIETLPDQNQNPGQEHIPESVPQQQTSQENNNPAQNQLPAQAEYVKGAAAEDSFLETIQHKIFQLFGR